MKLEGSLLLASYTARSQAYAQALYNSGFEPERVILYGDPTWDVPRGNVADRATRDRTSIFLPNLDETLAETCERNGWSVTRIDSGNINDLPVFEAIKTSPAKFMVYSGYGGQLVEPHILDLGPPMIHMHAGWLPEYRGSTTIYYSMLMERTCAVTAFQLGKGIDTGPVFMRRHYPLPPPGLDVDSVYDNAIRADLLVRVMEHMVTHGRFPVAERQTGKGRDFYVIHPVLKHLAILSLEPSTGSLDDT